MSYRSLLVPLSQDPLCAARTQAAIRLARSFDAHLTGVAPTGLLDLPGSPTAAASLAEFAEVSWETLRQQSKEAAQTFRASCAAAGFTNCDALVEEGEDAIVLLRHANSHDLTVLTQADPDSPLYGRARQLVEQTVLFSARPVFILPYAGAFSGRCRTVMLAWDNSREAARAAADALPLLRQAKRVHAVTWKERGLSEETTRLESLHKWLLCHGIAAQAHTEPASTPIADAMLSCAADLGAELIVMGAYGHARWAERVLGGATRGLLRSMTVPVLMSH